jgi:hypothetical protein
LHHSVRADVFADVSQNFVAKFLPNFLAKFLPQTQPELKTLFYNGRHLKIQCMMSLQYAKGIPPGT